MALPAALSLGARMLASDTFANDVVLVTEASTPLALASAIEFARAGARLALLVSPGQARPDLRCFNGIGPGLPLTLDCDVTDAQAVLAAFDAVHAALGPVSILLNNHGTVPMAAAERLSLVDWRRITSRILDGVFVCSTEFARRRIQDGAAGAILNLVDTMAWNGGPALIHAATATAGVLNLSKTLAVEWAPDNIRVNAIAPGPFAGDPGAAQLLARLQGRELAHSLPAMRLGQPHEFGWAATFLCSPFSAYTTGATLIIDGGEHLRRSISGLPFVAPRELATLASNAY